MYYDGHVHTPFCPHGSSDAFETYIEKAISLGIKGLTFTEHAPLPKNFQDPAPTRDSAMVYEDLNRYFNKIHELKKTYKNAIEIKTGLEIDFIEGYETETGQLLREIWPELDDAILSVHFLRVDGKFYCMDYDDKVFGEMVDRTGSVSSVYQKYYETVQKSVDHIFSRNQPLRIGHITLANKFQKIYPAENKWHSSIERIIETVSKRGMSLDYNGAGTVKPFCLEPYPSDWVVKEAMKRKIPLVYGSDAHSAKGLGQGYDRLLYKNKLISPLLLERGK
jgi:histidinol-phosphatase (PHP family)